MNVCVRRQEVPDNSRRPGYTQLSRVQVATRKPFPEAQEKSRVPRSHRVFPGRKRDNTRGRGQSLPGLRRGPKQEKKTPPAPPPFRTPPGVVATGTRKHPRAPHG